MWSLRRPSDEAVASLLRRQAGAPYSYAAVGATRGEALAGYDHDHNRTRLGDGPAAFDAACVALRRWQQFPPGWTAIVPGAPPEAGREVALVARAMGLWWTSAARVVYVIDEAGPVRRWGYAYGTLAEHVEEGEERFVVEQLEDGSVWYDLRAFSRPRYWMVRLGYPLARRLQRRFARESLEAMKRAVASGRAS